MGRRSLFRGVVAAVFGILLTLTESSDHSSSQMLKLKDHLFDNYDGLIRPVKDGINSTLVTYRMILYALMDMDTRNQKFQITTWVKMSWTNEFLTWNATEYGGIEVIHVPADRVWLPDITLPQNVDEVFERYKPNTYVNIHSNGFTIWYVPTIFTSLCRQRVRYFPFDTQVCHMRLSSWAYDGDHIELRAEEGADTEQSRFLNTGVWSFVAFRTKQDVIYYQCCPTPYYELVYTIIFRRNSSFYIAYLILPCVFLSALSLLVFYLPPDCGEKLTLSITNLLALVVFQQLIAETMPPSGEESPMIGTFFLIKIVMVCISVVFTVIIIHVGFKKTNMPRWVEKVIINCLGYVTGLRSSDKRFELSYVGHGVALDASKHCNATKNGDSNGYLTGSNPNKPLKAEPNKDIEQADVTHMKDIMCAMNKDMKRKQTEDMLLAKWRLVSMIIDRVLMLTFTCFAAVVAVVMTTYVIIKSDQDYEDLIKTTETEL